MSGNVPPSSRAGKRSRSFARSRSDIRRAAEIYERFTGHDSEVIGKVDIPDLPSAVAVIGQCDGILYTTIRDGVVEKYIHRFRAADKPIFAISPDGKQIILVGGNYDFTDRGIVDASDLKNRR